MVATPSKTQAPMQVELVSGNPAALTAASFAAPAQVFKFGAKRNPSEDRNEICKAWQREAYRHVNICGEARYAASLFASMAGRAELGIGEPQSLRNKAKWISTGPEVDVLAELVPTVRDRTKMIRDYMLHRTIAGECYLIARDRTPSDPGYIPPPDPDMTWDEWIKSRVKSGIDALTYDPESENAKEDANPNEELWEIVAVTEIRRLGSGDWEVRHDNGNWLKLAKDNPVIRMWSPDPENRREAWSPFRSMLPTLREIEWLTKHIFTQVKSRLMSAGVWFLPENMVFKRPPDDAVEGGAEAIAKMNEAEQFMVSLASSSMEELSDDEVAFPSVVMVDAAALAQIDQKKLIQFWSEIDDKAMLMRSDAIRRFALGFDMPPEQAFGAAAVSRAEGGGSGGATNHWGEWAKEEQTIQNHIEPALDDFVGVLTYAVLRAAIPETKYIVAYDTSGLRAKQDRSKEALELNARGILNNARTLREIGFDPENDMMDDEEFKRWVLVKMIGGSPTPEQVAEAVKLLTGLFMPADTSSGEPVKGLPGRHRPGSTDDIEVQGPPEDDHEHQPAPYSADVSPKVAACEVLVLRALERAGNKLVNDRKRGKDRDRSIPLHLVHVGHERTKTYMASEFDFGLASTALMDLPGVTFSADLVKMGMFCADLYNTGTEYTREGLVKALG